MRCIFRFNTFKKPTISTCSNIFMDFTCNQFKHFHHALLHKKKSRTNQSFNIWLACCNFNPPHFHQLSKNYIHLCAGTCLSTFGCVYVDVNQFWKNYQIKQNHSSKIKEKIKQSIALFFFFYSIIKLFNIEEFFS